MKQDYRKLFEIHCLQVLKSGEITEIEHDQQFIEFEDMPKIIDSSHYVKGANKKQGYKPYKNTDYQANVYNNEAKWT